MCTMMNQVLEHVDTCTIYDRSTNHALDDGFPTGAKDIDTCSAEETKSVAALCMQRAACE